MLRLTGPGLLFAAFVAVPIVEIALFIKVGGWIGLWPTLAIVVATALAGTALMRAQGLAVLAELRARLDRGGDPTGPIAHGALILISGALLLTPGFFTDAIGFALLLPPVRTGLIRVGARVLAERIVVRGAGRSPGQQPGRPNVVDADFEVEPPEDTPPRPGGSGWTRSD